MPGSCSKITLSYRCPDPPCAVLCCAVLCCAVLRCGAVLVRCCACVVLGCAVLGCAVLGHAVLCSGMLCCAVLGWAVLCCAALFCAVLCCAVCDWTSAHVKESPAGLCLWLAVIPLRHAVTQLIPSFKCMPLLHCMFVGELMPSPISLSFWTHSILLSPYSLLSSPHCCFYAHC